MNTTILSGYVGQAFLCFVFGPFKNDALLVSLIRRSETLCCEKKTEFKRHIEPRHSRLNVYAIQREIMDRPSAASDNANDLIESDFTAIIAFSGASWSKPTVHDGKYISTKHARIIRRERAIYED